MTGIVVGIDGSEGSMLAFEWAAKEAHVRRAPLTVVLAWQLPTSVFAGAGWVGVGAELIEDLRKLAEQRLEESVAALASNLQGLEVSRKVAEGPAAAALVEAAKGAELLVVGTRGHGGFAGLLLGSVSQQCAQHSPCPVAIIPPSRAVT
jgi:nucleotide-binding universal stress UspA family protein